MGVTSNRVDVKRMGGLAERELERRAEPLAALFQAPAQWPQRLLELAWKEMVRNSAHDSICACSVDDVVDAVLHRYAEARTIATGLADRATKSFARSLAEPGTYVLNPAQRTRSGVVELVVGADRAAERRRAGALRAHRTPRIHGARRRHRPHRPRHAAGPQHRQRRLGPRRRSSRRTRRASTSPSSVGPDERHNVPIAQAKQDIYTRLGARPDAVVRIALNQPPIRRIVARVAEVAGLRLAAVRAGAADPPGRGRRSRAAGHALQRAGLGRGRRRPSARSRSTDGRATASWSTAATSGDSYNYSPPRQDTLRGHADLGGRPGARARTGAGPRGDHRHLPLARSRRRRLTGPGRRAHGRGRDRRSSCGPTSRWCG